MTATVERIETPLVQPDAKVSTMKLVQKSRGYQVKFYIDDIHMNIVHTED